MLTKPYSQIKMLLQKTMPRQSTTKNTLIICLQLVSLTIAIGMQNVHGADETKENRGQTLIRDLHERSMDTQIVTLQRMELRESGRTPRVRELYIFRRNHGKLPAASLVRFKAPADVANTGLLSIGDPTEGVDQWIYLPAHGRVRRIPTGRQGGRFAGSDFFYEDMRDRPVDLDRHHWKGEDKLNGQTVETVESTPLDPNTSTYDRRIYWIDTEKNIPMRIDFYRRGDTQPFKRFRVLETTVVDDLHVISDSIMEDLNSAHQTRLQTLRIERRYDLPEFLFTRQALEDPALDRPFQPSENP